MPLPHATLNAILEVEGTTHSVLQRNNITTDPQDLNMITCKTCKTPSNGLLKTPSGWVCPKCYKLIYVPEPTKADIVHALPYNTIDSYSIASN